MSIVNSLGNLLKHLQGGLTKEKIVKRLEEAAPPASLENSAWVDPAFAAEHQNNMRDPKYAEALRIGESLQAVDDDDLRGKPPSGKKLGRKL